MRGAETRYAKSGDVHIAYQVLGRGPIDIVFVQGFISNLEVQWEEPGLAHLLNRLAAIGRLILFDKRGSGLSDRVAEMPTLETRMDDVRAVLDAARSRQAVLIGASEGGPMAILFAATYPGRTRALVLYGAYAHFLTWVLSRQQVEAFVAAADRDWGSGGSLKSFAPGLLGDARFRDWWARFERLGASPAAAMALARMNSEIDVRPVLPAVRVPTLVIHRRNDVRVNIAAGRYLAAHIAGARYVEVDGSDHPIWVGDTDSVVDEIETFLTGARPAAAVNRLLSTVLAIDIADAARCVAHAGDRRWLETLGRFRSIVAEQIARFQGRALEPGRAGALAIFDGPTRAVRCAIAVRDAAGELGLEVRAGVHTGEIEIEGDAVGGIALHVADRIAAAARPGDVLVSGTVRDLVIGAPLQFSERGECALEGVVDRIRLLAVIDRPEPAPTVPADHPALRALSPREGEILDLVARGLTNPAIADALALSEHTVKRHVANILLKLDLPTRSAAAAFLATALRR
ncbi:alpha/beta fold hydrolase [Limobrevibacterium gyesilva]|uniref:Alpha/beta fold hydrolase n=1 Tax=Limobrevibacterium gyesilva TaxID=2991712 RepID=A0AA41YPX0_9PROT|nr:alpha/beta fold hydrolase [Limobrevibacterium gyesilva]MCW3476715.1 alpha/beta fold hydrolase [Limobrevibacterium gyesilva]